jgi:hypothetical protein
MSGEMTESLVLTPRVHRPPDPVVAVGARGVRNALTEAAREPLPGGVHLGALLGVMTMIEQISV